MPKYIKFFIPLLLLLEVFSYTKYGTTNLYLIFKYLQCCLLIYWVYQEFRYDFDLGLKLIFFRLFIPLYLLLKLYSRDLTLKINLELFFNFVDVFCLMVFFLIRTISNYQKLSTLTIQKIFISYIIVPILFFLVVLFPYLSQYYITIGIIYLLILIVTAIASVYYSTKPLVKLYVSMSVFCLMLSTGLGATGLFLGGFRGNVEINIVITMLSNIFLNMGLIEDKKYKKA